MALSVDMIDREEEKKLYDLFQKAKKDLQRMMLFMTVITTLVSLVVFYIIASVLVSIQHLFTPTYNLISFFCYAFIELWRIFFIENTLLACMVLLLISSRRVAKHTKKMLLKIQKLVESGEIDLDNMEEAKKILEKHLL